MINKAIFFNNIKLFLIMFNFEFKNEEDLKLYVNGCYLVMENLEENEFIKGIKNIIKNNKNSIFYRRPSPNDLMDMMGFLKPNKETIKHIQWACVLEKEEEKYNNITKLIIEKMSNAYGPVYWRFSPYNDNKENMNFLKKEFDDLYDAYSKKELLGPVLFEDNRAQNVIDGLTNKLKKIIK